MPSIGEFEKWHALLIVVARFAISCSLFATFGAEILKKAKHWRKLIMQIAIRILVVTLILAGSTLASAAGKGFTGPGPEPAPPVAVNF